MWSITYAIILLVCLTSLIDPCYCENSEKLYLQPLGNQLVHARFKFSTSTTWQSIEDGHYQLFPKALGEIIAKYNIEEIELSLTQGIWRYRQWGIPLEGSSNPSGASILAIFKNGTENVDKQWRGLVNSLAGLLCASLNFVDESVTVTPKYTFYPRGAVSSDEKFDISLLRYANLPQEFVCTENLTPWKKLLPCFGKAGLSSLLDSEPLFDSNYNSMSLTVRPVCSNTACDSITTQLTQSLSVVMDHTRRRYGSDNSFSIKSLFGKPVSRICHVATLSDVIIRYPTDGSLSLDLSSPSDLTTTEGDYHITRYPVSEEFDITASYSSLQSAARPAPPALHTRRYLSGYGQEYGSIVCEISNNAEEKVQIVYTDYIPWYLRVYLHTLSIESDDGSTLKPSKMSYSPGLDRKKAYMFELLINLPANSTTTIRFDVEKLFLKWTEYPPDANFGFYIPSATITAVIPDAPVDCTIQNLKEGYGVVRLQTEKLIVLLPTPDFSMPYNVICLACTVVALAFGSWYSMSTKTMIRQTVKPETFLTKLKSSIKGKFFSTSEPQVSDNDTESKQETEDVENEENDEIRKSSKPKSD